MTHRNPPSMSASASETHLRPLAERAILKPWAIPNPFRQAGKELTDLLVPFGEDLVVFSDKACKFDTEKPLDLAWGRWARAAIDGGVKQQGGAVRRLERPDNIIFTDQAGRDPLAYPGKTDVVSRQPKAVRDVAWKAQVRLCDRYRRLSAGGKRPTVVVAAIARELSGFISAIGQEVRPAAP